MQLSTEAHSQQEVEFPGGRVKCTSKLTFTCGTTEERAPCYRVLDESGHTIIDSDSVDVSYINVALVNIISKIVSFFLHKDIQMLWLHTD